MCSRLTMFDLLRDIRLTFRQLSQNPAFAITAVGTLALGIGATAAIFSLINAVVLRPLSLPQPDQLVWLQQVDHSSGLPPESPQPLSYPNYFDWRARGSSFQGMASYRRNSISLTGAGEPQQLPALTVSANFFRVLGIQPELGRDFLPEEEQPGTHVAVLSHELWQSTFGGARDLTSRSIILDGLSFTVAGVMPKQFTFPGSNPPPALWTTLSRDSEGPGQPLASQRGADMLDVVGRLKPGVSPTTARAGLDVVARQLAAQYPDTNKQYTSTLVQPMLEHLVGDYRPALRVLLGAVLCLLLMACANVAGLLLVRAWRRSPEIALRAALGASRAEITRQILTESVLLSLLGGALGIIFSTWILNALVRYVPQDIPRLDQIRVDGPVLAFVTFISVVTGVLFGAVPAWRASRLDPIVALREFGRSSTPGQGRNRLHHWIVIAETAIGLLLLVASGLLIRSFVNVLRVDPGFDPRHVLTASLSLSPKSYPQARELQFYDRLLPKLAALPGVESVAAGFPLPLAEGNIGVSFQIEGQPVDPGDSPDEQLTIVTPGFFHTMRIPVLKGREFTARDDKQGRPVMIVNERFAAKYFPGQNPIGRHIRSDISDGDGKPPMREVVAVVGNIKRRKLITGAEPIYYLPFAQSVITAPALCIRTIGDPAQLTAALRSEVQHLDPGVPVYRVRTLDSLVSGAAAQPRFHMMLLTSFALVALVLFGVGLYAVLSYLVAQRTKEIGLRMALGAQRANVLAWVLRSGLTMASVGAGIGLVLAIFLTRYLQSLLFGIKPLDAITLLAVVVTLLLVSAVASSAPALRASRLDPTQTLKQQ